MAEGGFPIQNQLKFNLGVPLSAANIAVRYHKPNPIVIERAGGLAERTNQQGPISRSPGQSSLNLSNVSEDRLALAVQLAKRDVKKRKENGGGSSRSPSPSAGTKPRRPLVSKGGTKIIQTKECRERAERLKEKRGRDPLKVREQGWNSGTSVARTQTPPRDKKRNLPVTTNSPPTRDTDKYPRVAPLDNPAEEIGRLQKEIEGYLQQIQVIEQRAMTDQPIEALQPSKSRKKDGYLSDEEDPARKVLRQEEQATRAARQIYNLRQQVRALQEHVTRKGSDTVKHTKKSQTMLRLAAAHRGAVRAIQSFVNQQLPLQDLRRGLPTRYHELALLIRQLALVSTQIKANKDTTEVHEDLVKMLDRVDELNRAWITDTGQGDSEGERRRKSPTGRQTESEVQRGRQPQPKRAGKENKPKGLLKKQFNKQTKPRQEPRKLTPERQNILRAGLESLVREDPQLRQGPSGMTWNIPMETSMVSEPANTSLILPKPLQHKREKAQKGVPLAVPETHFSDPTVSFNLKTVQLDDMTGSSREPWRPGGSVGKSPGRQPRSRSAERSRSQERSRSWSRSRSKSPRSARHVVINDIDQELISELFPERENRQQIRPRSASPRSPRRQRSRSPPRFRSERDVYAARGRMGRLHRGAEDVAMARERQRETAEINLRQMLADRAIEKAGVNGEVLSDMILHDLLRDTAEEMESLEDEQSAKKEAATMHHNPTLENMYQRLEQMELEQIDIRRRWGTLQFEEESDRRRTANIPERPSAPVAMEITRRQPSQSHRVQTSRAFHKEKDEPIIFTKSAPVPKFQEKRTPLVVDDENDEDVLRHTHRGPPRIRLKISETVVRDIKNNLEKYEHHLKKTQHEKEGRFDPWKLVEEISDLVLEECLREIDAEMDEIGEGIVHQVCKSEFSVPEPSVIAEQIAADRAHERTEQIQEISEMQERSRSEFQERSRSEYQERSRSEHQERSRSEFQERSRSGYQDRSRSEFQERSAKSQDKRVKIQEEPEQEYISKFGVDYNREDNFTPRINSQMERSDLDVSGEDEDTSPRVGRFESLADIEDLQAVDPQTETEIQTEIQTERENYDQSISRSEARPNRSEAGQSWSEAWPSRSEVRADEYDDDDYEDDDDDVEEVSPIDSDDLEYSTDET